MDSKKRFQNLQNRISGRNKEYNFLDSWHYLMLNYGWIPFEEFKKMDAHVIEEIIERCNKTAEEQKRRMK